MEEIPEKKRNDLDLWVSFFRHFGYEEVRMGDKLQIKSFTIHEDKCLMVI